MAGAAAQSATALVSAQSAGEGAVLWGAWEDSSGCAQTVLMLVLAEVGDEVWLALPGACGEDAALFTVEVAVGPGVGGMEVEVPIDVVTFARADVKGVTVARGLLADLSGVSLCAFAPDALPEVWLPSKSAQEELLHSLGLEPFGTGDKGDPEAGEPGFHVRGAPGLGPMSVRGRGGGGRTRGVGKASGASRAGRRPTGPAAAPAGQQTIASLTTLITDSVVEPLRGLTTRVKALELAAPGAPAPGHLFAPVARGTSVGPVTALAAAQAALLPEGQRPGVATTLGTAALRSRGKGLSPAPAAPATRMARGRAAAGASQAEGGTNGSAKVQTRGNDLASAIGALAEAVEFLKGPRGVALGAAKNRTELEQLGESSKEGGRMGIVSLERIQETVRSEPLIAIKASEAALVRTAGILAHEPWTFSGIACQDILPKLGTYKTYGRFVAIVAEALDRGRTLGAAQEHAFLLQAFNPQGRRGSPGQGSRVLLLPPARHPRPRHGQPPPPGAIGAGRARLIPPRRAPAGDGTEQAGSGEPRGRWGYGWRRRRGRGHPLDGAVQETRGFTEEDPIPIPTPSPSPTPIPIPPHTQKPLLAGSIASLGSSSFSSLTWVLLLGGLWLPSPLLWQAAQALLQLASGARAPGQQALVRPVLRPAGLPPA